MPEAVRPHFLYAGLNGPYSVIALEGLLQRGLFPQAVLLAQVAPSLPAAATSRALPVAVAEPPWRLAAVAERYGLALVYCPEPADIEATIARFRTEVILVAGWPKRVPAALLALPRHGWLNLHPSLLPAFRGPAPLFWQLLEGAELGVSLHKMDAGLDTGPLVAQARCPSVEGETLEALEIRLAGAGAGLFASALNGLQAGLVLTEQSVSGQSQQGWPQAEDYIIDSRRPAQVVYNFLIAMRAAGKSCGLRLQTGVLNVRTVLGWRPGKVIIECDTGRCEIETGE